MPPSPPTHDAAELVAWLSTPAAYPEVTARVELRETHISWVFLTDQHAYKLKKPVRFDFLDFSTLAARREACEAEIRLNRRLAPHVYLGVLPIIRAADGQFQFGGDGEISDYVVRMHRLPAERTLECLLENVRVNDVELDRVLDRLVNFYRGLSPVPINAAEYRREIIGHVVHNGLTLRSVEHALPPNVVRRVHNAQLQLIHFRPRLFDDRIAAGRIIEGHGDLRPEHVYLTEPPVIIDCVEFNRELRTLDELDEVCFLAMECDALEAGYAGDRLLRAYGMACGDHPPPELIAFYKAYRACVRAKVAGLRLLQMDQDRRVATLQTADKQVVADVFLNLGLQPEHGAALQSIDRYLQLADGYLAPYHQPLVIVVGGISGSGKSHIAAALRLALGTDLILTDGLRRDLFGPADQSAASAAARYSPENIGRVYNLMSDCTAASLKHRTSIILDGTFLKQSQRDAAKQLAHAHGCPWYYVECRCPPDVAKARIAARLAQGDPLSDARPELVDAQLAAAEPATDTLHTIAIDTTADRTANVQTTLAWLAERNET